MTEDERQVVKARKARLVEGILRKLFGDRKAEARLAEIDRERLKRGHAESAQSRCEDQ